MGLVIFGIIGLLIGLLIGLAIANRGLTTIITVGVILVLEKFFMPQSMLSFGMQTTFAAMGGATSGIKLFLGFSLYLILTGLVLGISFRLLGKFNKLDRSTIDLVASVIGLTIILTFIVWLVSFIIDIYSLGTFGASIPHIYSPGFTALLIEVVLIADFFLGANSGLEIGNSSKINFDSVLDNKPAIGGTKTNATREADVLIYKDDLDKLDNDVISGLITKERYARIITDIELAIELEEIEEVSKEDETVVEEQVQTEEIKQQLTKDEVEEPKQTEVVNLTDSDK